MTNILTTAFIITILLTSAGVATLFVVDEAEDIQTVQQQQLAHLQNSQLNFGAQLTDMKQDSNQMLEVLQRQNNYFNNLLAYHSEELEFMQLNIRKNKRTTAQLERDIEDVQSYTETTLSDYENTIAAVDEKIADLHLESDTFQPIIKDLLDASATIRLYEDSYELQSGSGVFFRAGGYLITNYHVINVEDNDYYQGGEVNIQVGLYNGAVYDAYVVDYDEDADIALLKIPVHVPYLEFADEVEIAEPVVAIGNSFGAYEFTVSEGIVSAVDREFEADNGEDYTYVQTDAFVIFGNSGGPLINQKGEIVGINSFISSYFVGSNTGFALRFDEVEEVIDNSVLG